jgi:hypothetical protein
MWSGVNQGGKFLNMGASRFRSATGDFGLLAATEVKGFSLGDMLKLVTLCTFLQSVDDLTYFLAGEGFGVHWRGGWIG